VQTQGRTNGRHDILSVSELDALYVGPNDLAISLGYAPPGVPTKPVVIEAINTIVAGAKRHGIYPGIHCGSAAIAKQMIAVGFQFVTLLADNAFLAAAAKSAVTELRTDQPAAVEPGGTY
jgi:4-hydroxy-2-oxoheptanedioate aldolase